jgi:hypothetical protein
MADPQVPTDGESESLAPIPFDWKRHIGAHYDVDYAESGNDLIYQFWPLDGEDDFRGGRVDGVPRFALVAEGVFKELLPESAKVSADMIDVDEQAAVARVQGVVDNKPEILEQRLLRPHEAAVEDLGDLPIRPTLYVRVHDMLDRPMAHEVLTTTLFAKLDTHLAA